ncbi:MAG: endonuclease domain-containing protein [Deferribacteraceae bacterium]|jgi:very-short-patch-repair endonuclease|nr:endonuclease domain-containing protein [Deferribacteraceae bacterium]
MNSLRKYSKNTLANAQTLRANATPHENILWHHIKNKQLMGYKFRRQQPIGQYIADFYCSEAKLIIELDGSQHSTTEAIEYDVKRDTYFQTNGYTVIRVWNNELLGNLAGVLELISNALENPTPKAKPSTLPQGEGEMKGHRAL